MPASTEPKYVFIDGVMQLNPKYVPDAKAGEPVKTTVADPQNAIAITSTMSDIAQAGEAKKAAGAGPLQTSKATEASITIMQDSYYLDKFGTPDQINPGELVDGITRYFAQYEVPLGLVNKLLALSEYKLNFIIDDSGSMMGHTDATINDACDFTKSKYDPQGKRAKSYNNKMTRWEEAEDRLHILIDMLAYIPTGPMKFGFLNNKSKKDIVVLDHHGKTPDQFKEEAHDKLHKAFKGISPECTTPILADLQAVFQTKEQAKKSGFEQKENVMHYLLTDGKPDEPITKIRDLVLNRAFPEKNPITFLSCTNNDAEVEWMKKLEGEADYSAELDDFISERNEVVEKQGSTFPYSKGFWLLSNLVAAINPDDLDALDEDRPFSKKTMDDLMGRKLTDQEFKKYFDNHPLGIAKEYIDLYPKFLSENTTAKKILEKYNHSLLEKTKDDLLKAPPSYSYSR